MPHGYFVDFWHGISVFANFSDGIAVLGTPQCPPLLATFHVHRTEIRIELSRNGSIYEFYRLKALITLEKVITSVVEKKNNLNEQNVEVYWKIRIGDGESGMEDRLKQTWKLNE